MKLKVKRARKVRPYAWNVLRTEECHDYCSRRLGTFQTWEQAIRYALAVAYGD